MEAAVNDSLSIVAEWEQLEAGSPEDRACFAAIGIFLGELALTEADDAFVNRIRRKVHLSAYKLAEWFAWNWWRQRWESSTRAPDWAMAHRMPTIGDGYVWPNISIISDGERITLVANPTEQHAAEPLRYIADIAGVVRAADFEGAVIRFIEQVRGQLREENIEATNLDHIWADVCAERADPETAKRRELEALLGFDPDEASAVLLERLIVEEAEIGDSAVREMAATSFGGGKVLSVGELKKIADSIGFDARPGDAVQLRSGAKLPAIGSVPAWRRGTAAAQALRAQERLGAGRISNAKLTKMSGVASTSLAGFKKGRDISFAMDDDQNSGRVVLRSKWEVGRRFELARLLGDRVSKSWAGRLIPATRTSTYRQKFQRSFAAELLCPFEALDEMLDGDFGEDKQEDAAQHFSVSPLAVRTLLVNHSRIKRDDADGEFGPVLAA